MLQVSISPPAGEYTEFIRITLVAFDDGNAPVISGPFEIVYTLDGTLPELDISGNPIGTTRKRRSPVKNIPISKPTTVLYFARTTDGSTVTPINKVYYALQEILAKNEIPTSTNTRNYTLAVENGDIVKNSRGVYNIVSDARKAQQDIREVILVENVPEETNPGDRLLPRWGSAISRLLGKPSPVGFAKGQIQTTIFEALTFLSELQRSNGVPNTEQIKKIRRIVVDTQPDPTSYKYEFSVELVSGEIITESGILKFKGSLT